ncbi:beta-3-deoxy-D-manno-oct-2-ulosonic acid transferase [Novosphingobium sp.]|uniref:capsular polysaccharide export protein, LipB/KpsS family n=1 Tax=Novosphingobium sp. TaxID=1874826 RepID=UPI0028A74687|nr:beta-3-deoxy-D-manno-oct-2-ulosonic acid transferase [Novosphingobium sp.]
MSPPFLRIPPFPGHRASPLAQDGTTPVTDAATLVDRLRRARVAGEFWAAAPSLPEGRTVLASASGTAAAGLVAQHLRDHFHDSDGMQQVVSRGRISGLEALPQVPAASDPWSLCAQADRVVADADDELLLIAALCGCEIEIVGSGRFAALSDPQGLEGAVAAELSRWTYRDPFDGSRITPAQAIDLLDGWRRLIEANRAVGAIYGIARWKRITADNLLWDGTGSVRHADGAPLTGHPARALAWIARSDAHVLSELEARGIAVGEIEDGMIRSTGLGANCVPPLSIVVDANGPHFDPAQASELEIILETATIPEPVLERARALRERLVAGGISKYGQDAGHAASANDAHRADDGHEARKLVLVTGQVEDDRSVLRGGGGLDNLQLLRRARDHEPQAHIVFKPHPDVEAGHRKGHVPDGRALEFADEIDRTSSIASLLDRVDAVHVLTSLAGFEALMRGREVVTHGVPFYAGWGLTRDLGEVPARRTRKRTLEELVAATLILYPRYLDPVTRLPCGPETLVDRIANGQANVRSGLIRLREVQGRMNRVLGWMTRR